MFRPACWLVLTICVACMSAAAARGIGSLYSDTDTYLAPGNCSQPCWHGIRPGTPIIGPIETQWTRTAQYSARFILGADNSTIREIQLITHGNLHLGDVVQAWGAPSHVQLHYVAATSQNKLVLVGALLYFGDGLIEVDAIREDNVWRLSPNMIVRQIRYFAPNALGAIIPLNTPPWQGFRSQPIPNR